jgi:hypothetical protein
MRSTDARPVELGHLETALGMTHAKVLDDSLAIRVGSAEVRSSDQRCGAESRSSVT